VNILTGSKGFTIAENTMEKGVSGKTNHIDKRHRAQGISGTMQTKKKKNPGSSSKSKRLMQYVWERSTRKRKGGRWRGKARGTLPHNKGMLRKPGGGGGEKNTPHKGTREGGGRY